MRRFWSNWWGKTIIIVLVIVVAFGGYYGAKAYMNRNARLQRMSGVATAVARKGSITVSVNGTGTVQPIDQADVTIDGSGVVKKVYVKEGDTVKKGDLMYELEDKDLELSIKQAELNISQMQLTADDIAKQISKAVITAPASGLLSLNVAAGDQASPNMPIGTVQDISKLSLSVSISGDEAMNIKEGQSAVVTVSGVSGSFKGSVVQINGQLRGDQNSSGGSTSYGGNAGQASSAVTVIIDVTNSGSKLRPGDTASAVIKTGAGDVIGSGQLSTKSSPVQIKAPISAEVKTLYASDGAIVSKGQKILAFDTTALQNNLDMQNVKIEQAQADLDNQKARLDKLKVYAPIDGTITVQNVQEGDQAGSISQASSSSSLSSSSNQQQSSISSYAAAASNSSTSSQSKNGVAATIADFSKFKVVVPVDELDINKIKIGDKAVITADALPGQSFNGEVTDIADQGTSQGGVATFNVTVTFDKAEGLKAGMTADVEIIAEQKDNVVMVPIEAVMERNGQKFVIVYDNNSTGKTTAQLMQSNIRQVETGINNESYIEIVSGLQEGERVVLQSSSQGGTVTNQRQNMPNGGIQFWRGSNSNGSNPFGGMQRQGNIQGNWRRSSD